MSGALAGRRLLLGVSGSIAAAKALALASQLVQAGAELDVVMTKAATELLRPLAFQALTHRPVATDLWDPRGALGMDHISLAQAAELFVVAPATANVLARLALGLADDALGTTALACAAPLLLAPAMEPAMWRHPATQGHVATLLARGAHLVGPSPGRLASGRSGLGRMAEPDEILAEILRLLAGGGALAGRRLLVTVGPTREPIDPVRFLSNHSSGRMGLAVARAALARGAAVTLVHGPLALALPAGATAIAVETAEEMLAAVLAEAALADALVMAAAVADYRPAERRPAKLKKGAATLSLRLERNPDVLLALDAALAGASRKPLRIGFAAETEDLVANARDKLTRKGLDLVVANPVPASFGGEMVAATLVEAAGARELGSMTKDALAGQLMDWLVARLGAAGPA